MKNKGSLVTCLFLIAAYGAIATATNISYGSGFTSAGLTLNGSAAINGTRLRLTNGGTSEAGSAFFNTPVNVQSFTNDFSFQLTNATADGFTFTLQGNNPNALGPKGGGLGYGADKPGGTPGIGRSVAVKFDLFSNAGEGNDSTGLYTSGASPTTPFVDLTNTGINLHSGHTFNVHMTYDGATLVVQITDATSSTSFHTSFPVNIPNLVGGSTGYVGFTGGSGGLTAVQDILSWTYVPSGSGNPQPLQITTGSLPAGAVGVSYQAVLAAANGVPPYTWSLMGGQLPSGLGLQASTGKISGTPSQAGAFTFSVQVKDSSGHTASGTLSANIAPASAPVISSVSPKSGSTAGGTTVTIAGSNFQAGAAVLFGGIAASSATVSGATQIHAVTPAHIAGTVDVTVRDPNGESSTLSSSFAYSASSTPPTISGVSPGSGAPRAQVTITGTNFKSGATVDFGTTNAASTVFVSSTELKTSVPTIAAGTYDVTVTNPDPSSATLRGGFTVTTPPPAQSLLSGMTPGNFKVPAGWALALTQDFESGSIGPNEYGYCCSSAVSTNVAHSGTHSWRGPVVGDGSNTAWGLHGYAVGVKNEVYMSWWSYLDPNARGQVEAQFANLQDPVASRSFGAACAGQQVKPAFMVDTDDYTANPYVYVNTNLTAHVYVENGCDVDLSNFYSWNLNLGIWQQQELWGKINTCTGGVPNKDGFYRFYINGQKVLDNEAFSWGGCWSGEGFRIEVGGVWTYQWASNASNQCVDPNSPGAKPVIGAPRFADAPKFEADGVTPCVGSITPFSQYMDDIIILHR
jgi:hypothetical protein